MLALRTSPPVFTAAEAERVVRDSYGLAVVASPLSGERDCNFRVRTADNLEYVLKIFDAHSGPGTADCQISVLRHLAEQDPNLPVPRVFPTQSGDDLGRIEAHGVVYATCLTGFLPGLLLFTLQADTSLLGSVGGTLARLDRSLRGFFHPALSQNLAWDVRRLPELVEFTAYLESPALRKLVESAASGLEARIPALRALRSQAIHGDCHGNNLLIAPELGAVSGVLDFGDMIHAPLIFEPAVAMSEFLTEGFASLDALPALLRGYTQRQPLEAADVEALFDVIAGRHAAMILVHAWRHEHDPRGAGLLARLAPRAGQSLERLLEAGRAPLTQAWHQAAGTAPPPRRAPVSLERRRRLMGKGSELFYEQPLHLVRGSGVWMYDPDGKAYLDVYNNVAHVGHAHPVVVEAIQKQTAILATHTRYLHGNILEYAERLTATLPPHLDTCIFVNSGSEANDVAWRIAQFATGHGGGIVMQHAYHGITEAVSALTPSSGEPRDPKVVTLAVPPDGLCAADTLSAEQQAAASEAADQAVRTLAGRGLKPAAFFIDSSMTSSGVFDPPRAWGAAVEARLRAAGCLIVADEVQYGLGRSGSHQWSFARRGLHPDLVTLGKPVGNGYPMGVVIASRSLIEAFQAKFGFFSTFGGNAVAAAAGLAVLEVLEREQLMSNAARTGDYLHRRLSEMAARHVSLGRVRGAGLLLGLEVLPSASETARLRAKRIINALASRSQILIGYEGPQANLLKLRPPMPFQPEHVELLVGAIDTAATSLDAAN